MTEHPLILCPQCSWTKRHTCRICHGAGKLTEEEFHNWVVHFMGGFFSEQDRSDAEIFFNEIDNF